MTMIEMTMLEMKMILMMINLIAHIVAESSQRMGRLVLWLALAVLLPAPAILQPLDQVPLSSIVCFSILSELFWITLVQNQTNVAKLPSYIWVNCITPSMSFTVGITTIIMIA